MTGTISILGETPQAEPTITATCLEGYSTAVEASVLQAYAAPNAPVRHHLLKFTQELADHICNEIASGSTLRRICQQPGMPHPSTVFRWFDTYAEFADNYVKALRWRAESRADEVVEIAYDSARDYRPADYQLSEGTTPKLVPDREMVARSELKIKTLFRLMAMESPRKYGTESPEQPPLPASNGDDAKVIDGTQIPIEEHPLYESVKAWGRVAKG